MKFKNNLPIYLQIANHFLENILDKKWVGGEKIPSIRDTAIEYEVNPNTTMRTYTHLQEKGIIYNKRGLGYFVADDGYIKSVDILKQQFIDEDLPSIFKTMNLLGISIEEIQKYYLINKKES